MIPEGDEPSRFQRTVRTFRRFVKALLDANGVKEAQFTSVLRERVWKTNVDTYLHPFERHCEAHRITKPRVVGVLGQHRSGKDTERLDREPKLATFFGTLAMFAIDLD